MLVNTLREHVGPSFRAHEDETVAHLNLRSRNSILAYHSEF